MNLETAATTAGPDAIIEGHGGYPFRVITVHPDAAEVRQLNLAGWTPIPHAEARILRFDENDIDEWSILSTPHHRTTLDTHPRFTTADTMAAVASPTPNRTTNQETNNMPASLITRIPAVGDVVEFSPVAFDVPGENRGTVTSIETGGTGNLYFHIAASPGGVVRTTTPDGMPVGSEWVVAVDQTPAPATTFPVRDLSPVDAGKLVGFGGIIEWSRGSNGRYRIAERTAPQEEVTRSTAVIRLNDDDTVMPGFEGYTLGSLNSDTAWIARSAATPTAATPTRMFIPRTAGEAKTMLTVLEPVMSDHDVFTALKVLAKFLPGATAEAETRLAADRLDLCHQYDRIVCPTLGWCPRPGANYDTGQFESTIADAERGVDASGRYDAIIRFASRYARGGEVNQALTDHIESHLERHKHAAATELLEGLGMEGVADVDQEYIVWVDVTRTVEVQATQRVAVRVTASDVDAASELVDSDAVASAVDDYNWEVNSDTVYARTYYGSDIDDYEVDYAEQD